MLPFEMSQVAVYQPGAESAWVHLWLPPEQPESGVSAEVTLADARGDLVAQVKGLRLQRANPEALHKAEGEAPTQPFLKLVWQPAPLAEPAERPGSVVVVARAASAAAADARRSLWW